MLLVPGPSVTTILVLGRHPVTGSVADIMTATAVVAVGDVIAAAGAEIEIEAAVGVEAVGFEAEAVT